MRFVATLIALLIASAPVQITTAKPEQSNVNNGIYLLVACRETIKGIEGQVVDKFSQAYEAGICMGLVQGVTWGSSSICSPDGVNLEQEVRVVVKYLDNHPEQLHMIRPKLVDDALTEAFPCRPK